MSDGNARDLVRVVAWNVRAGGGRRVDGIASQLEAWGADVAVLLEARRTEAGLRLASMVAEAGLAQQRASVTPRASTNGVLVASRWPLRAVGVRGERPDAARWVLVRVAAPRPFAVGGMHVPNRVTGLKWPFHASVLGLARGWRGGPALFAGDTNSGRIELDEERAAFNAREDRWMTDLERAGWADAFRHAHGAAQEFTWYSPNGRNGFRLDQAFVHRSLLPRMVGVRHAWGGWDGSVSMRREVLSDHAAVIVELDLGG
ncbi:MAG: endonuclease/exonuclease/phosphatase family protein [Dehalococcoidia bacterium]